MKFSIHTHSTIPLRIQGVGDQIRALILLLHNKPLDPRRYNDLDGKHMLAWAEKMKTVVTKCQGRDDKTLSTLIYALDADPKDIHIGVASYSLTWGWG